MKRLVALPVAVAAVLIALAAPSFACGGLVAPNGSVRLTKTATLAAYVDGNEHYITSFQFASTEQSFGSIVPIPGEPTKVERAGDWTLQRLAREVAPPVEKFEADAAAPQAASGGVVELQHTKVDSLDITIVKGGGKDVAEWAKTKGFTLDDGTPAMLEFYSNRSPYFMATKFDAAEAKGKGLQNGDGIPIALTIPTRNPWVPIKILSLGKPGDEFVDADVFLLTDKKPAVMRTPGTQIAKSESASKSLLNDLRSDKNSDWVPQAGWLTYMTVGARADQLTQDIAVDTSGNDRPSLIDAGLAIPTGVGTGSGNTTTSRVASTDPQSAFAGTPELAQDSSTGLSSLLVLGAVLAGATLTFVLSVAFFTRKPTKVVTVHTPEGERVAVGADDLPSSPPLR